MVRKRSQSRMDGKPNDSWRYSPVQTSQDRMPVWQVAVLVVLSVAMLWAVLGYVHPRNRAAKSFSNHMPKCFPLDDRDAVKLLGSQNSLAHRAIATGSEYAQTLFDLGLLALAGFNQGEAASMFTACLRQDPSAAMCHWGLAYAQGPMPNKVPGKLGDPYPAFLPTHATDAHSHAQAALRHSHAALGAAHLNVGLVRREQALVQALAQRFAEGAAALKGGKWRTAEARYAQRMQQLAEEEQDADAFAWAAEAYMNLTPWDYYAEDGSLRPTAATAEALLLQALKLQPHHLHALHLHIHIAEAGQPAPQPGQEHTAAARALGSAETLAGLLPQNGHLLHMPSHIFVRTGRYAQAVAVNRAAYEHDLARGSQCITPYLPEHNVNLLVYAASMAGMLHTAESFATGMRNLRERLPSTWMAQGNEWVALPALHIRYGAWDKLLAMQPPPRDARGVTALGGPQYAAVLYHAGRSLALAARAAAASQQLLGLEDVTAFDLARKSLSLREKEVAQEHEQLQMAVRAVPTEPLTRPGAPPGMYASAYRSLAAVAGGLVSARLRLLHNNTAGALDALREAVGVEDGLGYMEPPRLHQPLRQCLGWLLLHAGQLEEAASVYSEDLAQHPNNGWSLLGLAQVARVLGAGAAEAAARHKAAWADAEVQIDSSCPALA
ncbi:hypothetical protein OEZ86_013787 [Tetradesmus obliquus]|nr:hypothetical protein OEZ86_013787 [Tetradesmus obliquus]